MEKKIFEIINKVLKENKIKQPKKINLSMDLKNDLGIDSMTMVHLVVAIDDEFGVDIFSDGMVKTVDNLVQIIISKS